MTKDMDTSASRSTSNKGSPSHVTLGVTMLVHFLLLAPVIYILVLAFQAYSFFSWHPICMTLGAGLLVMEAIFAISGEAYLSMRLSRLNRVRFHWILQTTGLCLMFIGLIIIVVNKNNMNKWHFTTSHGQLGLSAIILSCITAAGGILANNTAWLYPRVRPVLLKVVHAIVGICVTIILIATLITGLMGISGWWTNGTIGRDLSISSFFFAGLLILVKPVLAAVSRTRVILRPPTTNSS